jgi:MFS family permease
VSEHYLSPVADINSGGGLNVICPMYMAEASVAEHRGQNVGLHGSMFVAGLAVVNWASLGTYFSTNATLQWRLILALQVVAPIILLSLRFWLPESPRWLILHGQDELAYETLCKLHDTAEDDGHTVAQAERSLIRQQINLDGQHDTSWSALCRRPSTRRRLLLGVFMMFLQQSTGQNVLYGFQINVLTTLGLTGWQPLLVVSCYVTWAAALNFVGGYLMDRLGRRVMILGALVYKQSHR